MRHDFRIEIDLTILNVVRVRNLSIDHESHIDLSLTSPILL